MKLSRRQERGTTGGLVVNKSDRLICRTVPRRARRPRRRPPRFPLPARPPLVVPVPHQPKLHPVQVRRPEHRDDRAAPARRPRLLARVADASAQYVVPRREQRLEEEPRDEHHLGDVQGEEQRRYQPLLPAHHVRAGDGVDAARVNQLRDALDAPHEGGEGHDHLGRLDRPRHRIPEQAHGHTREQGDVAPQVRRAQVTARVPAAVDLVGNRRASRRRAAPIPRRGDRARPSSCRPSSVSRTIRGPRCAGRRA